MAQGSDDVVSSQSLPEETTPSLHMLPLPTLPFDLLSEILCRLPVKLLVQLRCLCKFFNSLISDPEFTKKHLHLSTTRHHLILSSKNDKSRELRLFDFPISSVFSSSIVTQTQLNLPISLKTNGYGKHLAVCSCDGILCISSTSVDHRYAILWNPSIRKFKILPPQEDYRWKRVFDSFYSFGYDHFIHNYKVIVIYLCITSKTNEVRVHTLGTDNWRRMHDFPFCGLIRGSGIFVSGTVNWFAFDVPNNCRREIVSFDLEKESFKILSQPNLEKDSWNLGVLKDCLCIFSHNDIFVDVWIMKEYGNKESWTKLYNISYMGVPISHAYGNVLYISEDNQMLVDLMREGNKRKIVLYNSKNGILNFREIEIGHLMSPNVYIESLVSP